MPNPKGNPDITKYSFKTDRPEACTEQITIRIPPSMKAKLKNIDNWREEVRKALEHLVQVESSKNK